ncbi:hypothetical protein IGI37_002347 [Enterococcus sp. AZ194]|uniref:hypothetical protein n=1 Tax=Enterococcus sp. AZ194 TaxID=2774629 RepID=UPI003F27F635
METMGDVLLVIDLQNGVCFNEEQTIDHLAALTELVNKRMEQYANEKRPIIFVQHCDEELMTGPPLGRLFRKLIRPSRPHILSKKHMPMPFIRQN